jgi:hypothetical protein
MANNKDKAFKVGEMVEAIGLVGASHLNGKWGWIARDINSSGRLAVYFDDDDLPKLSHLFRLGKMILVVYSCLQMERVRQF